MLNQPRPQEPLPTIRVEGVGGDGEAVDKYTAGIELSNACRQFYVNRVKASAKVKERLGLEERRAGTTGRGVVDPGPGRHGTTAVSHPPPAVAPGGSGSISEGGKPNSIDAAMQVLKREMASLIDQDLALMGQLLTLNEQIEELKWQRKLRGYSRGSLESSCNLDVSNFSVCTSSEVGPSNMDVRELLTKYPSPSDLSLYNEQSPRSSEERETSLPAEDVPSGGRTTTSGRRPESTSDLGSSDELVVEAFTKNSRLSPERARSRGAVHSTSPHHTRGSQDQQSFDSGIHDPEPGHLIEILL